MSNPTYDIEFIPTPLDTPTKVTPFQFRERVGTEPENSLFSGPVRVGDRLVLVAYEIERKDGWLTVNARWHPVRPTLFQRISRWTRRLMSVITTNTTGGTQP